MYDTWLDTGIEQRLLILMNRFVDILDRTEVGDELGCGFLSNTRHSFDVVGRVTAESFVVRDELGREAVAVDDSLFVIENGVVQPFLQCVYLHTLTLNKLHR